MFRPLHPAFQSFYSDPCMLSPPPKKDVACMTKKNGEMQGSILLNEMKSAGPN